MEPREKLLLSIAEASKLFGIGQQRLRRIMSDDVEFKYHATVGRSIKVKRIPFENYIYSTQQI